MMSRRRIIGIALLISLLILGFIVIALPQLSPTGTSKILPADSVETLDGVEFRHYFTEAAGFTWHSVEAGEGPVIVFIHGIPGAWYSWHRVMALLKDDYRVIAIDLKGLGLSDQPEGSYSAEVVAGETIQLMDAIGVDQFTIVGHEWGSMVASYVAGLYPQRVTHFVRIEAPLSDAALSQIQTLKTVPQMGTVVLGDGKGFVRRMYTGESSSFLMNNVPGPLVVQSVPAEDIDRLVTEFSYKGIPQVIIHYYEDSPADLRAEVIRLAATTTMPVLLLQADADPVQPLSFYEDAAKPFANATLTIIKDSGHVPMLEQPAAVAEAIQAFVAAP